MLKRNKNKNKKHIGPITMMIAITIVVMFLSFILNKLGFKGYITEMDMSSTDLVTVNNAFSKEGIQQIIGNSVANFRALEPLVVLIMSLISISVLEASGLLYHLFTPLKRIKPSILTFIIMFISIISTIIGDYSYAILLPVIGILYNYIGRDPKLGIMTVFIGITMGYGTGLMFNYQDIQLGSMTEIAALDVLKDYSFSQMSIILLMIISTVILSLVGSYAINHYFNKKYKSEEIEEFNKSGRALKVTALVFIIFLAIFIYSIIPNLPLSGLLLDSNNGSYMDQLFSEHAAFREGFLLLFIIVFMICGYIYGKISRNIKNNKEYNKAISKAFENTGFLFASLFFASLMISIIDWTNITTVISVNLIDFLGKMQLSGFFLIVLTLLVCIIISIISPKTIYNWQLMAPVLVPLLIRANITPSFTQFIFKVADSIGKSFSPIYIYLIIAIGFLYKYDDDRDNITIFGTIKKMMPITIMLTIAWIVIILGWNLLGMRTGLGTYTTI